MLISKICRVERKKGFLILTSNISEIYGPINLPNELGRCLCKIYTSIKFYFSYRWPKEMTLILFYKLFFA